MTTIDGWECHAREDGRLARCGPVLVTWTSEGLGIVDPTLSTTVPPAVVRWLLAPSFASTDPDSEALRRRPDQEAK